ncbi:MAG: DUF1600 domain-containing protein, partial [Mycoplasma sp.]
MKFTKTFSYIKKPDTEQNSEYIYFWSMLITVIQFFSFILVTYLGFVSFGDYKLHYDIQSLPDEISMLRASFNWLLVFLMAMTTLNTYLFYKIFRKDNAPWVKFNLFTISIFSIFTIYIIYKKNYEDQIFKKLGEYFKKEEFVYTNIKSWWKKPFQKNADNLHKMTWWYVIALVTTLIGTFVVIILPYFDTVNNYGVRKYLIINSFSFFTDITNISCFIFIAWCLFMKNQSIFKNHTILIFVSSYIAVVSIGHWASKIIPWTSGVLGIEYTIENIFYIIKTYWTHSITPIVMLLVFIMTMKYNPQKPNSNRKILFKFGFYPFFYALYLYSLPFLIPFSVYGFSTNANSHLNIVYYNTQIEGNAIVLLGSVLVAVVLYLSYFIHLYIA